VSRCLKGGGTCIAREKHSCQSAGAVLRYELVTVICERTSGTMSRQMSSVKPFQQRETCHLIPSFNSCFTRCGTCELTALCSDSMLVKGMCRPFDRNSVNTTGGRFKIFVQPLWSPAEESAPQSTTANATKSYWKIEQQKAESGSSSCTLNCLAVSAKICASDWHDGQRPRAYEGWMYLPSSLRNLNGEESCSRTYFKTEKIGVTCHASRAA
jgi:hypothetical protein